MFRVVERTSWLSDLWVEVVVVAGARRVFFFARRWGRVIVALLGTFTLTVLVAPEESGTAAVAVAGTLTVVLAWFSDCAGAFFTFPSRRQFQGDCGVVVSLCHQRVYLLFQGTFRWCGGRWGSRRWLHRWCVRRSGSAVALASVIFVKFRAVVVPGFYEHNSCWSNPCT